MRSTFLPRISETSFNSHELIYIAIDFYCLWIFLFIYFCQSEVIIFNSTPVNIICICFKSFDWVPEAKLLSQTLIIIVVAIHENQIVEK